MTNETMPAAVRSNGGLGGWRPIETAPKDGSTVLVWFSDLYNGTADLARWDNDQYARKPRPYWTGNRERILGTVAYRQGKPTHWMPLPEPPNAEVTGRL